MKETIYTIPITEAFEQRDGCPLCRLADDLERKSVDYITGAAMMEPDVREQTNRLGFCARHYGMMLSQKNRLSVALTMQSRLEFLKRAAGEGKKAAGLLREASGACFVCRRVDDYMEHYYRNLLFMWKSEEGFRGLFATQPYFCLPHTAGLAAHAEKTLSRGDCRAFMDVLLPIAEKSISALYGDITAFCDSFDYRSAGKPLDDGAKTSVERAAAFLCGGGPEKFRKPE